MSRRAVRPHERPARARHLGVSVDAGDDALVAGAIGFKLARCPSESSLSRKSAAATDWLIEAVVKRPALQLTVVTFFAKRSSVNGALTVPGLRGVLIENRYDLEKVAGQLACIISWRAFSVRSERDQAS